MHWAVALPFMTCYATALILVLVYNPDPSRPYREVVSWTHRISGVCLFILPALNFVRYWRDAGLHLHNVRQAWSWSWQDVRWLFLIVPSSVIQMTLPHQGKFNAGEKINFMVLCSTYPVYLLTGLLIWFGASPYLSWLVHFSLAIVATPLLLGHVFMATVNPDTRKGLQGMITGFVDRNWAKHHYHHWYVEHFEAPARRAWAWRRRVGRSRNTEAQPRPRSTSLPEAFAHHDPQQPPGAWPGSAPPRRGTYRPPAASSRARP